MDKIEEFLKNRVLPELDKGRKGFDRLHTEAVVFWIKKIIDNSPDFNLDRRVLLIAAYAHDLGYAGLFSNKNVPDFEEVANAKENHMRLGAEKLKTILKDHIFDPLSATQKERCVHLVSVHDKLNSLKDADELVLMEADTFGGLDCEFVTPTYDFESNQKYIKEVLETRVPKFITDFSKNNINSQIQKRVEYYKLHSNN